MLVLLLPAGAVPAASLGGLLDILHTNAVHDHSVADPVNEYMGYAEIAQYKMDAAAFSASVLLLNAFEAAMGMPIVNPSKCEYATTS